MWRQDGVYCLVKRMEPILDLAKALSTCEACESAQVQSKSRQDAPCCKSFLFRPKLFEPSNPTIACYVTSLI